MAQLNEIDDISHDRKTNVRWHVVIILFIITAVSVGDRSTLAIAGKDMTSALGINPGQMGWIFSAFAWAYCLAQIPGGWLLDRFGSKKIYLAGLCLWSVFTLLQGCVEIFHGLGAVVCFTILLFLVGLCEAPVMPGVLLIEGMAQTAGALCVNAKLTATPRVVYFMTINNAKFRKPVVPGDVLVMELELTK